MKNKMYYLFLCVVIGIAFLIFGIEVFHNKNFLKLDGSHHTKDTE